MVVEDCKPQALVVLLLHSGERARYIVDDSNREIFMFDEGMVNMR